MPRYLNNAILIYIYYNLWTLSGNEFKFNLDQHNVALNTVKHAYHKMKIKIYFKNKK